MSTLGASGSWPMSPSAGGGGGERAGAPTGLPGLAVPPTDVPETGGRRAGAVPTTNRASDRPGQHGGAGVGGPRRRPCASRAGNADLAPHDAADAAGYPASAGGDAAGTGRGRLLPATLSHLRHRRDRCRDSPACRCLSRPQVRTLAAWLREHPGVEIVCRDGAAGYADAVHQALPDALQVGDRWHIWHNFAETARKEVAVHSGCWASASRVRRLDGGTTTTLTRWHQVHDLLDAGVGLGECARRLNLALNTVKRYARIDKPEQMRRAPQYLTLQARPAAAQPPGHSPA